MPIDRRSSDPTSSTLRPCDPSPSRRKLLLGASVLPFLATGARAQDAKDKYPSKPIRLIVPYTAGSIGDLFIRPVVQELGQRLGQPIICDNRPGASQAIGAEQAARAAPDGYTLFLGTQSGLVLSKFVRKTLPFDAIKDFTPISMLFIAPMYLFVRTSLPVKDVHQLIALAKSEPGKLTFASIGAGTSSHLAGEMLKSRAGIDMLHVPYRGGPDATNALVGEQVDVMFNGGNTLPQVERGRVRVIGMGSIKRTTVMPDLATLDETGLKGFDVSPWFAMFGPAGMPRPLVDRLNKELVAILKEPAIHEKAANLSLEIETSTPDELAKTLKADFPVYEQVMHQAGIQPE